MKKALTLILAMLILGGILSGCEGQNVLSRTILTDIVQQAEDGDTAVTDDPQDVIMPDVTNLPKDVAAKKLRELGLVILPVPIFSETSDDLVFSQDIPAGTKVSYGDTVTIYYNMWNGKVSVSDLMVSDEKAERILAEMKSLFEKKFYRTDYYRFDLHTKGDTAYVRLVDENDQPAYGSWDEAQTWYSDDPGVATVNNDGKITAVGEGSTAIRTKLGGEDYTCCVVCSFTGGDNIAIPNVMHLPEEEAVERLKPCGVQVDVHDMSLSPSESAENNGLVIGQRSSTAAEGYVILEISRPRWVYAYQACLAAIDDGFEYSLYDIEKDGIPELFLKSGTSEADFKYNVYRYDPQKDAATDLGTVRGDHGNVCGLDKNNAVLFHSTHMGEERICESWVENGTLQEKELLNRTVEYYDEYLDLEAVTSYFADDDSGFMSWRKNEAENSSQILDSVIS